MSTTMTLCPPIALMQARCHQAEPAGADDDDRLVLQRRADFLQRAEGGDARAGERRGALRRQVADVEQMARMRHHQMSGCSRRWRNTPRLLRRLAEVFVAALADDALAAADPGIGEHARRRSCTPLRVRAERDDLADILMAERERQLDAALEQVEPLAAAEIVSSRPRCGGRCGRRRPPSPSAAPRCRPAPASAASMQLQRRAATGKPGSYAWYGPPRGLHAAVET